MKFLSRRTLYVVIAIVVVLVAIRALLPVAIKTWANKKLDEAPQYRGHIADVDLHLYRGAYQIEGVTVTKVTGEVPVPFFKAPLIDVSIAWRALLDGSFVAEFDIWQPEINFVDGRTEADTQTGGSLEAWQNIIQDLTPVRIDRFSVHDGSLHFRNFNSTPSVNVYLNNIDAEARNLTNSRDLSDTLVASVRGTAMAMNDAALEFELKVDPYQSQPTFDLDTRMESLPVAHIDELIRAYAPFDLEAGSLTIASEIAASKGAITGYVTPILHHVEVFRWKEDVVKDKDNIFRVLWESVVGLFSELLENQPQDQIATRVPIAGEFTDPQTDVFVTIGGIFRNAFIEAYKSRLEGSVSLEDAEAEENKKEESEDRDDADDEKKPRPKSDLR